LNSKEFLKTTTDDQIRVLVSGGVSGSAMPPWSLDFGGTLTDEQVRQVVTYLRSLEPKAPSVPGWRQGKTAGT
jgi:mono/diheme cytochrome c family protein